MSLVSVSSGSIQPFKGYLVAGTGSVTYNSVVLTAGSTFIGVSGVTTFSVTSGSPLIYEDFIGAELDSEFQNQSSIPPIPAFLKGSFSDTFMGMELDTEYQNQSPTPPVPAFLKGSFSDTFMAMGLSVEVFGSVSVKNSPISAWF